MGRRPRSRCQRSILMITEDTAMSRSPRMGVWSKEGADERTPRNPTLRDGWKERCSIGVKSKCGRGQ